MPLGKTWRHPMSKAYPSLTEFADINILLPGTEGHLEKKISSFSNDTPHPVGKRKIQWDRPEDTTPAPDKDAPRCDQCGRVMALLSFRDKKFWSCLHPRCVYKERIPRNTPIDIKPICHKCGSDMCYFQEPYRLSVALQCPKCKYRQEF